MHTLEVGKLYHPGIRHWPEGGEYNFRSGGHELLLRFVRPAAQEVEAVSRGDCEFALASVGDILFFLYRFGKAVRWSDAPYAWHLLPEDQRIPPLHPNTDQTRALLRVVLLDAATGIVRALRAVTLSPGFTRSLHSAIQVQMNTPWVGNREYDRRLAAAYRRYPSSEDLFSITVAHTNGEI
jgi:hypothetical protein